VGIRRPADKSRQAAALLFLPRRNTAPNRSRHMNKEFSKQGWISGTAIAFITAVWVISAVVSVAQSGLVA
jgi:hypothetical protein